MKLGVLTVATLLAARSALGFAQPGQVTVNQYPGSMLSTKDVQTIVSNGSRQLNNVQTGMPCGLNLAVATPLTTSPISIVFAGDLDRICKGRALIYVVSAINSCSSGMYDVDESNVIYGCSIKGCATIVDLNLLNDDPAGNVDLAESQWMHEYGHTQGLPDRSGDDLLMNPFLFPNQFGVSSFECAIMKGDSPPEQPPVPGIETRPSIMEFVRPVYFHGIPLQQARAYTPEEVATVTSLLASCIPRNPDRCKGLPVTALPNIVLVAGLAGSTATAFRDLHAFVDRPDIESKWLYQARLAVPLAMGYLLRRNRDDAAALDFLENGAHPNAWKNRNVLSSPGTADLTPIALAKYSILGLGLSRHPRALQFLKELQKDKSQFFLDDSVQKLLKHAARVNLDSK